MTTHKTHAWREVRRPLSAAREAEIRAQIDADVARLKLPELRRARKASQASLADAMGLSQGDVSRIEHRTDLYIRTLRRYIEAAGGQLRIMAEFPDSEPVEITGFGDVDPTAARDSVKPLKRRALRR